MFWLNLQQINKGKSMQELTFAKEAFSRFFSSCASFLISAASCRPAVAPDKVFVCREFSALLLCCWKECSESRLERTGDRSESESCRWLEVFVRGGDRSEPESWRRLPAWAVFIADLSLALTGDRSESESCRFPGVIESSRPLARTGDRSESESWWRNVWLPVRTGERSDELESESCRRSDRCLILTGERSESESCLRWDLSLGTSRSESESWRFVAGTPWWPLDNFLVSSALWLTLLCDW